MEAKSTKPSLRERVLEAGQRNSIPVRATTETLAQQGFSSNNRKSRPQNRALLNELKQKLKKAMIKTPYKNVRLYDGKGDLSKEWYIEYHYLHPDAMKFKRIKERFDMNRLKTFTERRSYAKECLQFMIDQLKSGFNPFEQMKVIGNTEDFKISIQLQKILNKMSAKATQDAKNSYQEHYNRFHRFLQSQCITTLHVADITVDHGRKYKESLLNEGLAIKTVNASLSYIGKFWDNAIDLNWAAANPFKSVVRAKEKDRPATATRKETYEPLTSVEMEYLFSMLKEKGEYNFIRFLSVIFYAWVRPKEISRLKVGDIDFTRGVIRFRSSQTKNKKADYVQIVPPLRKILKQMKLQEYPVHYFLFSGDGDGFMPGITQLKKDRAGNRWREQVKNVSRKYNVNGKKRAYVSCGDGIDKDMYALKHTGNIEYLLQNVGNVDLKWQQKQNRHSSSEMTERYNRKLGTYLIDVDKINYKHFEI